MAEDGIADYGHAKRKAARQLGAEDNVALPTNAEIEAELRVYQSLYQGEEQTQRLRELRLAALQVMDMLHQFRPYLTGAVLDGTAGRYAVIELDAYAQSGKDVEIFLLNRNIEYDHAEAPRGAPEGLEAVLRFDYAGAPVCLRVFDPVAERTQRRNPRNGRTVERARADAVAALVEEDGK
jgi:hypothetical protein